MEKLILTTVKVMPIPEAVAIPMAGLQISAETGFTPSDVQQHAAKSALDELARWARALKGLREGG